MVTNFYNTLLLLLIICLFPFCKKDKKKEEPVVESPPAPVAKIMTLDKLAINLQLPWGMGFLPNGDLVFSERPGKINIMKKGESTFSPIYSAQVQTNGEGGMLSIAIDPDFNNNHFVFVYITTDSNRVVRFKFENNILNQDKIIVGGIPKGNNHDGGCIKFGPDGYLYIGTGDVTQPNLAQDLNSPAGKILRVDRDGNIPAGNPFNSRIWTYGHRNVQGFCWTGNAVMLATEHGPSLEFGWVAHDEINIIEAGKNYGWPLALAGTETGPLTPPLLNSGDDTWAPSGCTYLGNESVWPNCLVVACLRGQRLLRLYLNSDGKTIRLRSDTLVEECKRLRNIIEAPDHSLLFSTSNIGSTNPLPLAEDDKIYRLYLK